MNRFNESYDERFRKLSSTDISDALDVLGIHDSTCGIRPMTERWTETIGPTVAMRMTAAEETKQKTYLGMNAVSAAEKDDVIVINSGGRMDTSRWGSILANAARVKEISGMVINGCCHDLSNCMDADYAVYVRGAMVYTARGRMMEGNTNQVVQFEGVQVHPRDIVMGDNSGVVVIPQEHMEAVLLKAEEFWQREEDMAAEVRSSADILGADVKYNYNRIPQK